MPGGPGEVVGGNGEVEARRASRALRARALHRVSVA